MVLNIRFWLSIVVVIIVQQGWSQSFFSERTRQYKSIIPTRSVMPGASIDINGDLVDDIVVIDRGNTLKTILSTGKNFELLSGNNIKTTTLRDWSLAAGDLNNDGIMEVITTGEYSQGTITSLNTSSQLTKKTINTNVYAQGSAIVDLNNDGWLDYFLCNEDGPPKTYLNDKTGTLREKNIIPFLENDNTDGSGNYGVVWTDVNGDYLPDMILSKCKAGVTDPTDKRRINRLYINNGNGTYTEKGAAFNLNSGAQTWVTVVADFDNDGDMDALVVNHYSPHQLMENMDNTHFEERSLPEVLSSFSFQAVAMDVDNDGLIDILLSGAEGGILLYNKGKMQFEIHKDVFNKFTVHSFSIGDYNDDGFPDIHAHLGLPVNDIGLSDDQLWINNANENHYIKINLRGTTSNLTAIGAHLTLYTPSGKQVRMVKGGESYGICNSFQQIFGLGRSTDIDSLVVRWPSGLKETYVDIYVDRTYLIQEARCVTQQIALYEDDIIWKNSNVLLKAPTGFKQYNWSNNQTTSSIAASPGLYHVSMTDSNGCVTVSKPVKVVSGCFDTKTDILKEDYLAICAGDSVEIFPSIIASSLIWQDSLILNTYTTDNTGWVRLAATDYCNQTIRDSVFVERFSFDFEVTSDVIQKGQSAILTSTESLTNWYRSPDFDNPIGFGKSFKTAPLDTSTIFGARASSLLNFKSNILGEHDIPIASQFHINTASGSMLFTVEETCILHQFTVSTDIVGIRRIYILNNNKDTVFVKNYNLPQGVSKIELNASLVPGNYSIGTDERVNISSLGYKSPRLARTSGKTAYPYVINDGMQITACTFGPTVYLYFYDWEIYTDLLYCEGDLKVFPILVDTTTLTQSTHTLNVNICPNPMESWLNIQTDESIDKIEIATLSGAIIINCLYRDNLIYLGNLPAGTYILSIIKGNINKKFKLIKI